MKAIVYSQYGPPDVLHVKEVDQPVPKDNEVLIRVHATPINYGDLLARNFGNVTSHEFNMPLILLLPAKISFGFSRPKKQILGSELAGSIEAIGKDVRKFKVGDDVFAYCGMNMGANAEYLCMPESGMLALKPANMSFEEACAVPYGGIMATSLLKKANIQKGQKVLINGASGGIGFMALQLARHYGAEVTGVCSTQRLDYVKALGADKVIDYTKEDFTQNGEKYDLIFDILGKSSFCRCKDSLTANGRYLLASFKMKQLLQMLGTAIMGGKKVICSIATELPEDMATLKELAEAGVIRTIVDRMFPMEQAAEAHRYAESGLKKGAVVIKMTA
jgi:NADPH:quinone reductase-like Zn-dependent oxidoreductase